MCFWNIFPRIVGNMFQSEKHEYIYEEALPPTTPAVTIDLTTTHPQSQSPLFGKIPGEIRNEIFSLALQEYVDPENLYGREEYCTRPGYEGNKRIDVALLRTCKLIWSETRGIPEKNTEIVVWVGNRERAPRNVLPLFHWRYAWEVSGQGYVNRLLNKSHADGTHLQNRMRIFAQMYAIESGFLNMFSFNEEAEWFLRPKIVTLTLRYTDWWYWENNSPIHPIANTEFFSMPGVSLPASVEKMVVEFENIEAKKKELEGVISELFANKDRYVWIRQDGVILQLKGDERQGAVKEWEWMGPTRINGNLYEHHGTGDSMKMIVKVVEWVAQEPVPTSAYPKT